MMTRRDVLKWLGGGAAALVMGFPEINRPASAAIITVEPSWELDPLWASASTASDGRPAPTEWIWNCCTCGECPDCNDARAHKYEWVTPPWEALILSDEHDA